MTWPEISEGQLRRLFPGWPASAPLELLLGVREADRQMGPLVKANNWRDVPSVINASVDALRTQFPAYDRELCAFALDWLANAHEACGDRALAIGCIELRLGMRIPRSPWRALRYLELVTLLVAEREFERARKYARRGVRYTQQRKDERMLAALQGQLDQLG